jgi:AcrR family transcriptional regulator
MSIATLGAAASLSDRHAELTRRAILDAAAALVQADPPGPLTVRSIAAQAEIAERTVFRHFASRDALLDAVAADVRARMALPPPPGTLDELLDAPRRLYRRFEAVRRLTRGAIRTELYDRMRETQGRERWDAIRRIVDAHARGVGERERRIASANVRYHLMASAWHYYRDYFGFPLEEAIACAEVAVRQSLEGVGIATPARGARGGRRAPIR